MADVAIRYARALFETALAGGTTATERYGQLLERFAESVSSDVVFRLFLLSPQTGKRKKKELLSSVFSQGDDRKFLEFLLILVDKNRIGLINMICIDYRRMLLASQETLEAKIESAFALDQKTVEKITTTFCKKTGARKINASVTIIPELVGGIRVIIGSTIYDGTTRPELDRLYDTMTM
jgi:F-type H+-transporting ATPase subunit delta